MVYPGAAMPNVLALMQGQQVLSCKDVPIIASNGGVEKNKKIRKQNFFTIFRALA